MVGSLVAMAPLTPLAPDAVWDLSAWEVALPYAHSTACHILHRHWAENIYATPSVTYLLFTVAAFLLLQACVPAVASISAVARVDAVASIPLLLPHFCNKRSLLLLTSLLFIWRSFYRWKRPCYCWLGVPLVVGSSVVVGVLSVAAPAIAEVHALADVVAVRLNDSVSVCMHACILNYRMNLVFCFRTIERSKTGGEELGNLLKCRISDLWPQNGRLSGISLKFMSNSFKNDHSNMN